MTAMAAAAASQIASEAIRALASLQADQLEDLSQQASALAAAPLQSPDAANALDLRAIALADSGSALPELQARIRLLGSLVRCTRENLTVLQRAARPQANDPEQRVPSWVA